MIPSQFYPTVSSDYFPTTDNTIEVTGDIREQSDFADKYVYPYLMGYIKTSNIPACFRIPKVIFNTQEKTITATYGEISDEYSDFMYSYPAYNVVYSKTCMTDRTLATDSYSIKCFNSLAPLQCYSNSYNQVITFDTISLDETENSNVYSYETFISSTSAQQTINFLNGNGTINFAYRLSGDSTDRTKPLSLNDFNNDGVHIFTITENNVEHTIYIFIINVINNFTYYYDANGISGNTNYIQNATQATIHYKINDNSDDNDYVITFHPNGGESTIALLEVAHTGTGYNDVISNLDTVINGYSRRLHFELSDFVYGNLDSKIVYQNGKTFIAYWRSLTSFEDYYIIRGWTPNDVKFYLAMFPTLSDGTESGRYLPRIVDNELTGEFFNYYAIDDLGTEWQKSKEIADNEYKESDKPSPSDDDPLTQPNDPGKRESKIIGDRTGSGGAARLIPYSGVQYYVMTGQSLLQLRSLVWAQTKDFYSALNIINTEGTDTIFNYISSLRYYPFSDITNFIDTSSTYESVVLGTGATLQNTAITPYTDFTLRAVEGRHFDSTLCYWNLSDFPWRDNFLDFTPYSKLVVSIPYCGDVELDLNRVAAFGPLSDTVLWLWGSGDIDSGTITFSLFTGAPGEPYDQILYSKNVKIAIDLPLSGNDQISQSNAILQATYNQASKILSVGSSLISEGVSTIGKGLSKELGVGDVAKFATDAVQGVMDIGMASAEASLAKRQVPVSIGDINGTVATTRTRQYPYLTLYRQKTANPANYGHTTGFVCEAAYTLRELSGFTVLSNPDLNMVQGATQEELSELMGILTTGFYI